jgi:hypothetical protein
MTKKNLKKRIEKLEAEVGISKKREVIKIRGWGLTKKNLDEEGYGTIVIES